MTGKDRKKIEEVLGVKFAERYTAPEKAWNRLVNHWTREMVHDMQIKGINLKELLAEIESTDGLPYWTRSHEFQDMVLYSTGEIIIGREERQVSYTELMVSVDEIGSRRREGTQTEVVFTMGVARGWETVWKPFYHTPGLLETTVRAWRLFTTCLTEKGQIEVEGRLKMLLSAGLLTSTGNDCTRFIDVFTEGQCREIGRALIQGDVVVGEDTVDQTLRLLCKRVEVGAPAIEIEVGMIGRTLEEHERGVPQPHRGFRPHWERGRVFGDGGYAGMGIRLNTEGLVSEWIPGEQSVPTTGETGGKVVVEKANQVLVFRAMAGRCIHIHKRLRVAEFGPSVGEYTYTFSSLHEGVRFVRIIGASGLGFPDVWGWTVHIVGEGLVLVLPNKVWDSMVWLWERDMWLWPQMLEAEGIRIGQLPCFNKNEGDQCEGSLPDYRRYDKAPWQGWIPQPLGAEKLQATLASDEADRGGIMELNIPPVAFIERLQAIRKSVEGYKGLTEAGLAAVLTLAIKKYMGMLCSYGRDSLIVWQRPHYMSETRTWWWVRTSGVRAVAEKPSVFPPISLIVEELTERGLNITTGVFGYNIRTHKSKGGVKPGKVLSKYKIWRLGYKGIVGMVQVGGLYSLRDSTDAMKCGSLVMRETTDKSTKNHSRMVSKTPTTTPLQRTYQRWPRVGVPPRQRDTHTPLCGDTKCGEKDCNPTTDYINYKGR